MSHLTDAQNLELNSAIKNALQRGVEMRWQRRSGSRSTVELVSVFSMFNGTERTRSLYRTDSPYGPISARTITNMVRALGGTISDPEPVFQAINNPDDPDDINNRAYRLRTI